MSDLITVTDTTYLGGVIALVVFGALRFRDDLVDAVVALGDSPVAEQYDDTDVSGPRR